MSTVKQAIANAIWMADLCEEKAEELFDLMGGMRMRGWMGEEGGGDGGRHVIVDGEDGEDDGIEGVAYGEEV